MKRILFTLLALVVAPTLYGQNIPEYRSEAVEATEDYQQGNAFQQDLLLYADMLATTHPYYADAKHRATLDKRVRKIYKECGGLTDVADFKLELAKLAAMLGDGHTAISYWSNLNRIFSLRMTLEDGGRGIVDVTSEEYRDLLGREVVSVNGRSLKKILAEARAIVSADNDVHFLNSVKEYMMMSEFWSFLGMSDRTMTLKFADGGSAEILAIDKSALRIAQLQRGGTERVTAMRNTLFDYTIYEAEGICYLQFNQMADRLTYPQYPQLARFDEFVEEMMTDIEAKGIKTLVVDLQYNSGGNSMLGDVLLSWLKPYAETKRYGVDVRISKMLLERYSYYDNFTYDGEKLKLGEVYDMWQFDHNRGQEIDYTAQQDSSNYVLNFDAQRIFKGNVVFVEGSNSFSSATLLLTKARDNGVGIIIGEPSAGKPNHYGDLLYCTLPNTKTIATVSHKHFVRPNREAKASEYIVPDVSIDLNDPERDNLWEWTLKTYDVK